MELCKSEVDRDPLAQVRLLLVCTANQGRSAMAEALLRARLLKRGLDGAVAVGSAGFMEGGVPASQPVLDAVRPYGANLSGHRSRRLGEDLLAGADLVVAAAREHVRQVLSLDAAARVRTFTLKELVRCAETAESRAPDERLADYLARLDRSRGWRSRSAPGSNDIADPYGRPVDAVAATAAEIDALLGRMIERIWPA
jgi:protein-tyrosine-phosphatase